MDRVSFGKAAGTVEPGIAAPSWPLQLAATAAFSLYLYSLMWWTEPRDMKLYLRPWFEHIVHYGPVNAFAHPFSNYAPAYLYVLALASVFHPALDPMFIIKLLSLAGTAFAAFAVADLIKSTGGQPRYAILVFALPSVVINSALLAQCDALWAGACVLAISAMIRGHTLRSLIWCGVAFAFKAQAAFVAPFIIGALIGRRAPVWQWAVPALVFIGSMVPAWLAGWPAAQLAMVYPAQASWWASPGRLANPWIFVTVFASGPTDHLYWIGYASAVVASVLIGWRTSRCTSSRQAMLLLALLSSLALPFCLPKMLERYYFLADVLSLALAVSYASRLTIIVAVAVELASLLSLLSYMYFYSAPVPTLVGAVCATWALLVTCLLLRRSGRDDTVDEQGRWPLAATIGEQTLA